MAAWGGCSKLKKTEKMCLEFSQHRSGTFPIEGVPMTEMTGASGSAEV